MILSGLVYFRMQNNKRNIEKYQKDVIDFASNIQTGMKDPVEHIISKYLGFKLNSRNEHLYSLHSLRSQGL